MESFFWTFLYTLLHTNRDKLENKDTQLLKQLIPDTRDYIADAAAKTSLLTDLMGARSALYSGSVLEPYRSYVSRLAYLAFDLNQETKDDTFGGYDLQAELGVIQEYISAFEMLLKDLQQKTASG